MEKVFIPRCPRGKVSLPGSKSIAHRVLICAALTGSGLTVKNCGKSLDVTATADALRTLGAEIVVEKPGEYRVGAGIFSKKNIKRPRIAVGESASTLRFLLPLCLSEGFGAEFVCSGRLADRPMDDFEQLCRENGADFYRRENVFYLDGKLTGHKFALSARVSSQFVSGLMLALARMGGGEIVLSSGTVSRDYIRMTAGVMEYFGADAEISPGYDRICVSGGYSCPADTAFTVGDDVSAGAVFGLLDLVSRGAGGIADVPESPDLTAEYPDGKTKTARGLQGDGAWRDLLLQLENGRPTISLRDVPDLAPTLAAAAAILNGGEFTGAERLRTKESDRLDAICTELRKFGADLRTVSDGKGEKLIVEPGKLTSASDILLGHGDHRIVMTMSVLASVFGGTVTDTEAVNKSFPDFFDVLEGLFE